VDTWWGPVVVPVYNASVFPNLAGAHGITSLATLPVAQAAGEASANLATITHLIFEVT
jgi:hypothetical protein